METMLDLTDCPKLTRSNGKSLKQLINNRKIKIGMILYFQNIALMIQV